MNQQNTGIIYLLKDKIQIFINNNPEIYELAFEPTFFNNWNIINKEIFIQKIKSFISKKNIPPSNLLLVISDFASFTKEFKTSQDLQSSPAPKINYSTQREIQSFIKTIPFKEISTKAIPSPTGVYVFTTNKEIIETIKKTFEEQNSKIVYALPARLFSGDIHMSPSLTLQNATTIFSEALSVKKYDLLAPPTVADTNIQVPQIDPEEYFDKERTKKDILRLYALVSVFGSIILSMLVVWFLNPYPQIYRGRAVIEQLLHPSQTKNLSLQIQNCTKSQQISKDLKTSLEKFNFNLLSTQDIGTCPYPQSTIVFSANVSAEIRGAILQEVSKFTPNPDILESTNEEFDIQIILTK